MNEKDIKRFARYRAGYIEIPELEKDKDKDKDSNVIKSIKLGFIDDIIIDKDKLINSVIIKNSFKMSI